jgi:hypothetical protein
VPTVGPTVTYLGVARADGRLVAPLATLPDGTQIFQRFVGFGFFLVVEGKPGPTNRPVGQSTFNSNPGDPNALPNLQILLSRAIGDGSPLVCDAGPNPPIGGVPAVDPPMFGGTQASADAINDLGCRFTARGTAENACTRNANSEAAFANPAETRVQFCPALGIGTEVKFPVGDTRVTARLTDVLGQAGAPRSIIIRVLD